MKAIKAALVIIGFLMLWFGAFCDMDEEHTLTIKHPNGDVLHREVVGHGDSLTEPEEFLTGSDHFQGYYDSSSLQSKHEDNFMPDDDLTLYAAYTDSEGFMAISDVPETIGDKEVRSRFGTSRQGFTRVGSTLHYIGGVGPHLVDESGDFRGFDYYSDIHVAYDLETHSWTLHPDLPAEIGFLDAVHHGDSIYILGGEWLGEGGYQKQQHLRYDLDSKTYEAIADAPFNFQASNGSVLHEDKIYVFTGTRQVMTEEGPEFETTDRTLIYDIESNSWSEGAPAPFETSGGSAAMIGDSIYVYRSASSTRSHFAKYDPLEDTWEDGLEDPEYHVSHSSSTTIDDKLVISGGWKTGIGSTSGVVQMYDLKTDSWEAFAELKANDDGGIGYVAQYAYEDSLYYLAGESHTEDRNYSSHYRIYQIKEEWIKS